MVFPLWARDTGALARAFIAAGFEAVLVCVENGESHTFVHAGPIFSEPIACELGEVVTLEV